MISIQSEPMDEAEEATEGNLPEEPQAMGAAEEARGLVEQIRQLGHEVDIVASKLVEGRSDMTVQVAGTTRDIKGWVKVVEYLYGVTTGFAVTYAMQRQAKSDRPDPTKTI